MMNVNKYLKENQHIVYQTIVNAINNKRFSHSYLITGEVGAPLKEVATYLAKSLLCENPNPLACNECITCKKIDDNNYTDLIIIDGEEREIKKEDIERITNSFSYSSTEKKRRCVYILNLVEHANDSAINALLKFLEEPFNDTYAFITTRNDNLVLPTIVSRCQILKLNLIPRDKIIEKCDKEIAQDDIELLSYFYNDVDSIKEVSKEKDYIKIKEIFNELINSIHDSDLFLYNIENLVPSIKTKEDIRILLDMFIEFLLDLNRKNNRESIFLKSYDKIFIDLEVKLNHIDKLLLEIMNIKNNINYNVSLLSCLEHLGVYIKENCL